MYERLRQSEGRGNGGIDADPLIPLRRRPQVALSRSIIAILEDYRVRIPDYGHISIEDCRELPLVVLATLCQAGLLQRPAEAADRGR